MFRRYRQRRGPYAMAAPSPVPSIVRSLVLLALVLLILWFAGRFILRLFGGGNQVQRAAVQLEVEGGNVNYSLEGGLMQRAEDSLPLYAGDRVTTGGNGNAILLFFDGSLARIDAQADVTIGESNRGSKESELELELTKGAVWVKTPRLDTYSGSIVRRVITPLFDAQLPSDSEVVIEERGLIVFSGDGDGVAVHVRDMDETVVIGEGQQLSIPADAQGNIVSYRSAIDPLAVQSTFVEETRALNIRTQTGGSQTAPAVDAGEALTVTTPADKSIVTTATVKVEGTISPRVDRVRVNSYQATVNKELQTFAQELSLPEGEQMEIMVEALDARGVVLSKVSRTVSRGSQKIPQPTITAPALAGQTYRTQRTEVEIKGTAPATAAGIMVNDYRLQLFRAGDTTWSYLASTNLQNMKDGTNIYDISTIDAAGNRSDPVRITILLEAGSEGVVGGVSSTPSTSSVSSTVSEAQLPTNAPLMPGTLSVTGPTPGSTHTATGSEFLLEGTTPRESGSVWVNGYRLQLYEAGKTFWNYIARVDYGTLKPGTNVYRIVARNAKNEILDIFEYTVTYNP